MNTRSNLVKLLGVCIFLGIWQGFAVLSNTRMFPSAVTVFIQLGYLVKSGVLLENVLSTLSKGIGGLSLAVFAGSLLGIVCARNRYINAALNPLIAVLYPIPKLALYPIVILIFGLGAWSKIIQVSLECFFPLFVQVYAGTRAIPKSILWLASNNQVKGWRLLRDVLLPALLPSLLTGLRIATPIMLIVMCVTEFIGESSGLGYLIVRYSSYFDPASALAIVLTFGLLGLIADRLIVWTRTKAVFWEKQIKL